MWELRLLSVEGFRFDARCATFAADVDLHLGAGVRELRGHVRHPDPGLEARRKGPTGHDADLVVTLEHAVSRTRDPPAREEERGELLLGPAFTRGRDRLGADEAGVLLAAPAQA